MEIFKKIIFVATQLYQKNYLAACDGNISVKVEENLFAITPAGHAKAFLTPADICLMDGAGNALQGVPSTEKIMHLEVYRSCPQAQAVIHAHPPHAIAWSIARPELKELPAKVLSEVILGVGGIPFVPYARPGSAAMGEVLRPFLKEFRTMILSHHGALSWGEDLAEALNGMERIEHSATILKLANDLGKISDLPAPEIDYFKKAFRERGGRSL